MYDLFHVFRVEIQDDAAPVAGHRLYVYQDAAQVHGHSVVVLLGEQRDEMVPEHGQVRFLSHPVRQCGCPRPVTAGGGLPAATR